MAKPLDDLLNNLAALAPGLDTLGQTGKENLRALLQRLIEQLDLVSREEFDTQQALLTKAQQQLTALQQRLDQLEGTGEPAQGTAPPPP